MFPYSTEAAVSKKDQHEHEAHDDKQAPDPDAPAVDPAATVDTGAAPDQVVAVQPGEALHLVPTVEPEHEAAAIPAEPGADLFATWNRADGADA